MNTEAAKQFDEAIQHEWLWKNPAMSRMAVAICKVALTTDEFSANDLPEFEHGGRGICGSIFRRLVKDGVISPVMLAVDCPKVIHNEGGNRIGVYCLTCEKLARRLMAVHGGEAPEVELKQAELGV
jgi:hypothetical protein